MYRQIFGALLLLVAFNGLAAEPARKQLKAVKKASRNIQGAPLSTSSASQTQWQLPPEQLPAAESTAKTGELKTAQKIIPLPIYSTLPNEGSTFGFMPVLLYVEEPSQRTQSIIAPSISWNQVIRYTGTFRWYYYPSDDQTLTLIPSISSNVNRNLTLEYAHLPRGDKNITLESNLHLRRDIFYRFFGIGPLSLESDESSYTRTGGDVSSRIGFNVTKEFNVGVAFDAQRHLVEAQNVSFLPLSSAKFPDAPGMNAGATTLGQGVSVRYDTRDNREYSESGFASEIFAGLNENLINQATFTKMHAEAKGIWRESSRVQGAARAFWSQMNGENIPFMNQNNLGGSFRLRGFTENRFVDYNSWEAELEQRISFLQTNIYGVIADWRIDPFFTAGQVYHVGQSAFNRVKYAAGLGFRAFVQPNVLGRVDTSYSEDGIKVYVELGYPF